MTNSEKDNGKTWISSPLPRNSVMTSEDRNLELLPVTYNSKLAFLRYEFITYLKPSNN